MPIPPDVTDNGVPYDWGLSGPDGPWFVLKPIRGVHTPDDAEQAEWELLRQRDVLSFRVEWQERPSVQVGGLTVRELPRPDLLSTGQLEDYLCRLEPVLDDVLAAEEAFPEWELEKASRERQESQDGAGKSQDEAV